MDKLPSDAVNNDLISFVLITCVRSVAHIFRAVEVREINLRRANVRYFAARFCLAHRLLCAAVILSRT